ncbi:aminotransferase class I/II-fold pyridoxal phosphate-dependent enzyme [Amantichitinum ursilacus]|uniref:Putative aminotransferase n=1 Tax=Amantichitinum ursilacus TaxID=857265 RepID=A0A0N0GNH5_9NEIS|nr:aminotransferase class I/II-fold pyridoxal phosphate-dependent enzyme [Amantichitinum ursilacus]KPC52715.1 putative aminotransferase [Amantichitinum ursilacus]
MTPAAHAYRQLLQQGLQLDLSRGKPAPEQLDLSMPMLDMLASDSDCAASDGMDCRNYGGNGGIPEARQLFGALLGASAAQTVVCGSATLEMMHDCLMYALWHGFAPHAPWRTLQQLAFIAPVPGYDRHFSICAAYGITLYTVPLRDDGPDMDAVESLLAAHPDIRGMWCVPTYNNPTGTVYGDAVVRRLARMQAAPDFRLFWDDAYRHHHLGDTPRHTLNMLEECTAAGHPDRVLAFTSTAKMTFANAGVAAMAASPANIAWWLRHALVRSIGPDKINQLRHVRFMRDLPTVQALMRRHAAILRPRFQAVYDAFTQHLAGVPGVHWNQPQGGYFIHLQVPPGTAKLTVQLAREAGITVTPAGVSFPHGDPDDQYIRLAPSYPAVAEVATAAHGLALCLLYALELHAARATQALPA